MQRKKDEQLTLYVHWPLRLAEGNPHGTAQLGCDMARNHAIYLQVLTTLGFSES